MYIYIIPIRGSKSKSSSSITTTRKIYITKILGAFRMRPSRSTLVFRRMPLEYAWQLLSLSHPLSLLSLSLFYSWDCIYFSFCKGPTWVSPNTKAHLYSTACINYHRWKSFITFSFRVSVAYLNVITSSPFGCSITSGRFPRRPPLPYIQHHPLHQYMCVKIKRGFTFSATSGVMHRL